MKNLSVSLQCLSVYLWPHSRLSVCVRARVCMRVCLCVCVFSSSIVCIHIAFLYVCVFNYIDVYSFECTWISFSRLLCFSLLLLLSTREYAHGHIPLYWRLKERSVAHMINTNNSVVVAIAVVDGGGLFLATGGYFIDWHVKWTHTCSPKKVQKIIWGAKIIAFCTWILFNIYHILFFQL